MALLSAEMRAVGDDGEAGRLEPPVLASANGGDLQLRILAESEHYVVGHEYEETFLVEKRTGVTFRLGDHYGDPRCALIGPDEDWFVVGGDGLVYFDFSRGIRLWFRTPESSPRFVHAMRLDQPDKVRVLLDPWSGYASVWELDIRECIVHKVKDGPFLADQPYREDVGF